MMQNEDSDPDRVQKLHAKCNPNLCIHFVLWWYVYLVSSDKDIDG